MQTINYIPFNAHQYFTTLTRESVTMNRASGKHGLHGFVIWP